MTNNKTLPPQYTTASNDVRSDTFTTPTQEMLENAVRNASQGDVVYGEDYDTALLEQTVRELTGKSGALYCVSGTMANQIGIRTHLHQPPYSILCDYRAHVYTLESAGLAMLSQAMVTPVIPANGDYLTLEDIVDKVIPDDGDVHGAPTRVVSLENTLHGIIYPFEEVKRISDFCRAHGIKIHCDGARLWNASAETGITMDRWCALFDSVSLCLSKSIGAPMGSVLIGDADYIKKCAHFRKQQGGGVRQAGILTHMALHALRTDWVSRLRYSHKLAHSLAEFCAEHGIPLESPADTNFVFLDMRKAKMDPNYLITEGDKVNVRFMGGRVSFHYQITEETLEKIKVAVLNTFKHAKVHPHDATGHVKIYQTSK